MRPGILMDPFAIMDAFTMDIGVHAVTRGTRAATFAAKPGVDPLSKVPGWLLGADNEGNGIAGNPATNDFAKTLIHRIMRKLCQNTWFCMAMHGEQRTVDTGITLSTGVLSGERIWSARHVAKTLRRLEDKGHIRLLSVEEWCAELWSDYAVGTDLIANPSFSIPTEDLGARDHAPEMLVPRGMTAQLLGNSSPTFAMHGIKGTMTQTPRFEWVGTASQEPIRKFLGRDCLRTVRGYPGGMILRPVEDRNATTGFAFQIAAVPAGIYRFELEVSAENASDKVTLSDFYLLGLRVNVNSRAELSANDTSDGISIPEFCLLEFNDEYLQSVPIADHGRPSRIILHFDADPSRCRPQLFGATTTNRDVPSIAGGASYLFALWGATGLETQLAIPGATRGAPCRVFSKQAIPAGVSLVGTVVEDGLVEVTIYNDSAVAWNPSNSTWFVHVDDVQKIDEVHPFAGRSPSTWAFSLGVTLSKDGTDGELRCAAPRLTLTHRY
jgi:hypothetical protein